MLANPTSRSIEKRLEKLARRTKTFYVRESILEHLADLEDVYLAERRLEGIHKRRSRTVRLKAGQ